MVSPRGQGPTPSDQGPPGNFFAATRQSFVPGPVFGPTDNTTLQTLTFPLPQTAYGAALNLFLKGNTTTGAASSTTASNTTYPPPPYGYIRKFRVYNNQGVDLYSISGYGLFLKMIAERTVFDPSVQQTGQFVGGFSPSVFSQYFQAPASVGASTTDAGWRAMWRMPISWGEGLLAGLQLFQDPSVTYYLEVTFGSPSDLYSSTTGTVNTTGVTLTTEVELFQIPPRPVDRPALSYALIVLEDLTTTGFVAGADLPYKIVPGNMLCQVIHEFAQGSPLQPFSPANLGNLGLNYSQIQVPYKVPGNAFVYFRNRRILGRDMPPGVYMHHLDIPNGVPELKGGRDVLNLEQITDANSTIGIASGAPLTNPQLRTIRTLLAANR